MYTLGFRFKPWASDQAIVDGPSILNYLKEAAAENGIDKHMRFGQKVGRGQLVGRRQPWELTVDRARRASARSTAASCSPAAAITTTTRATAPEFAGRDDFERHHRSPAALAGGSRLPRQEDRRHRQWRHRRDADPRSDRFGRRPRHNVATLADLHRRDARQGPFAARMNRMLPTRRPPTPLPAGRPSLAARSITRLARRFPNFFRKALRTMAERRLPEGYRLRQALQPELQAVGSATVCMRRTATCSRRSARARRRRHRHHRTVHEDRASS